MFHADLHIHSRFSRACSKDCAIEHLAWRALRKSISVVGTGDFTHPARAAGLRESCAGHVRFLLSAEISTIYRGGDRARKAHHLTCALAFESADRITEAHSPPMLGREATTLSCDLDYFAMARAFRTGEGRAGTREFFPEEGNYHLDGSPR